MTAHLWMEAELNACTRVQKVPLDTNPLMWPQWKQHVQEFLLDTTLIDAMWAIQASKNEQEE